MFGSERKKIVWLCLILVVGTLTLYWPVRHHEFVVYDDRDYVTQNRWVKAGLTWESVKWAFVNVQVHNWHPLTLLSHMLDVELFGLEAGAHHLVNVIFHALNAVLLFLVLRQTTGACWRSVVVAALFAWHPLHVQSVAWVAERKDVLSTFFWLLTMGAYAGYAGAAKTLDAARKRQLYILTLSFFVLGLMSKPMVVTLPFVLLLMDFWPLQRVKEKKSGLVPWLKEHRGLVFEKIPFFLLTMAACAVTVFAQGKAIKPIELFPFSARVENSVVAYAGYLAKTLWPNKLAVFYPYHGNWPGWQVGLSLALLAALSVLVFRRGRKSPFAVTGWLWYLGTLVPVIGLVQVGGQSMADRYTYIPLTGIFIMVVWAMADWAKRHWSQPIIASVTSGVLILFALESARQLLPWKNSETLFRHAISVTRQNTVAYFNLGVALLEQGRVKEALPSFQQALEGAPGDADISHFIGQILCMQGRAEEAAPYLLVAEKAFHERLSSNATDAKASNRLAYTEASLGLALVLQKKQAEAIPHFRKALELDPDQWLACNELAWILATHRDASIRDGREAVRLAEHACRLTSWDRLEFMGTLDAAYAEAGQFDKAIATAENLIARAEKDGRSYLADIAAERLALYRAGKPFHP